MKYVVVIPARGGSKRLPRKNVTDLCGMPLIAYSIKYAKQELPDVEVYVSTDDEEIAQISQQYGAHIIQRPEELANDHATTAAALRHATEWLDANAHPFDYMITLQATNPLRPEGMLRDAVKMVEENKPTSLFAVNPILRKQGRIVDGHFQPVNYHFGQRSQDMEVWYYENGLLYFTHHDILLQEAVMTPDALPMVIDHIFGTIDIDTLDDFKQAEYYLKSFKQ